MEKPKYELTFWPFTGYDTYTKDEVVRYCVNNPDWQKFRKSMKGETTGHKLYMLSEWRDKFNEEPGLTYRSYHAKKGMQVQIANYLAALRRGGQLDMNNRVQR